MENAAYAKLKGCCGLLQKRLSREAAGFVPKAAIVLGSGLGAYARNIEIVCEAAYSDIDGFPVSTVPGHKGKLIFGRIGTLPVVCMQGRVHYYEGYPMEDVVLPVRLMGLLGARILLLTNASGGVNPSYMAGDLMLIRDHISCFVPNPLIGPNISELGARFPDMSAVYDGELNRIIRKTAQEEGITLREGVYAQLTGPSYESPAEVRMIRMLGADAVGMSTAVEAIAARHMGMRVCGISCISNPAAGMTENVLCHEEVQKAADMAAPRFERLVTKSVRRMESAALRNGDSCEGD